MREILTLTTTPTGSAPDGGGALRIPGDASSATADGALVARACLGEALAFELLVVKYQRRAAAEIRRVVHDAAITEELTQDAFLRAYDGLPELQERDRFWPWLRTICRNVASSYLRSGQNRLDDRPADPDAASTIDQVRQLEERLLLTHMLLLQAKSFQRFQSIDQASSN